MGKIELASMVFGLMTSYASSATPVRKHQLSGEIAADGHVEISDSSIESASKQSPSLVRDARQQKYIDGDDDGSTWSSDHIADSMRKPSPSLVRDARHSKGIEVDANGNAEISHHFDATSEVSPSLVRKEGDANVNAELSDRFVDPASKLSLGVVRDAKQQTIKYTERAKWTMPAALLSLFSAKPEPKKGALYLALFLLGFSCVCCCLYIVLKAALDEEEDDEGEVRSPPPSAETDRRPIEDTS